MNILQTIIKSVNGTALGMQDIQSALTPDQTNKQTNITLHYITLDYIQPDNFH